MCVVVLCVCCGCVVCVLCVLPHLICIASGRGVCVCCVCAVCVLCVSFNSAKLNVLHIQLCKVECVLSMWLFVLGVLCGGLDATMLFGHTIRLQLLL